MTSRQRLDAGHGRQGGRIVTFQQPPDPKRCSECSTLLLAAEVAAGKCSGCTPSPPNLFDSEEGPR